MRTMTGKQIKRIIALEILAVVAAVICFVVYCVVTGRPIVIIN